MKNADYVEALTAAKKRLWDGIGPYNGGRYICDCLMDACNKDKTITWQQFGATQDMIHSRLGTEFSVREWLFTAGYITANTPDADIQAYRLRWVESMIAEFSQE